MGDNLSGEMMGTVVATGLDNKCACYLRSSINTALVGSQSVPSAVFSSDTGSAATAAAPAAAPAAPAAAAKPVEEESSDNRYYDELLAILNKRK